MCEYTVTCCIRISHLFLLLTCYSNVLLQSIPQVCSRPIRMTLATPPTAQTVTISLNFSRTRGFGEVKSWPPPPPQQQTKRKVKRKKALPCIDIRASLPIHFLSTALPQHCTHRSDKSHVTIGVSHGRCHSGHRDLGPAVSSC